MTTLTSSSFASLLLGAFVAVSALAAPTVHDFAEGSTGTSHVLTRHGAEPGPTVKDGRLILLRGLRARAPLSNSIAFERSAEGTHEEVELRFRFAVDPGAHGFGAALLSTAEHGESGPAPEVEAWEAPSVKGSFAVGIDVHDPATGHWFDEHGNFYDRPQRQVSLHHDGRELLKLLSPVEFRDRELHEMAVVLRHDAGGAFVDLTIDGQSLLKNRFLPGVLPYESRLAFGGRTGKLTTGVVLDDVSLQYRRPRPAAEISPAPLTVRTFDDAHLHIEQRTFQQTFQLPPAELPVRRLLLTVDLGPAPEGWDEWDRGAAIHVFRGKGEQREKIEVLRYITPYERAYAWTADVTDFQSVLRGEVEMELQVDSWQGHGFLIDVDLHYYPGLPDREAFAVENLWNVFHTFGNTPAEIAASFPSQTRRVPTDAEAGRLRFSVTGHGGFGEFTPAWLVATVDGRRHRHHLWRDDCYLNPVRPQGGTWKFDRAGWAPGDLVEPWFVELPAGSLRRGGTVSLGYGPEPFDLEPGQEIQASHWVASQLVYYRTPVKPSVDVAWLSELLSWREQRNRGLRRETGYLALAGLHWLDEGRNHFGSGEDNDFVHDMEGVPERVGTFFLRGDRLSFRAAPDVEVTIEDEAVRRAELRFDDHEEGPSRLTIGDVVVWPIRRGDQLGLRLRDPRSHVLASFEGVESFEPDPRWRLQGRFVAHEEPKTIEQPNILGSSYEDTSPGDLLVWIDGEEHRLVPTGDPERGMFLVLGDETNADTTYGGGRFLVLPPVGADGWVEVDFNRAYNPPCAFSPYTTCPIPLEENILPVAIEAGETLTSSWE
ncbi:MAG: DUF1684 domain-containing protein [Acidobacteriota bacterium]